MNPERKTNTWLDFMTLTTRDLRREYDLDYAFRKNMFYLFQIASGIWKYGGVEDNKRFPVELERRYFFNGLSGIVEHNGKPVAVDASPYGLDVYGLPTDFNFCFKNGETPNAYNKEIGVNGVLGYNSYLYIPTYFFAFDYAMKLAHIDLSIVCRTVNDRDVKTFIATNDAGKDSADAYYTALYNGRPRAIVNKANISFTCEHSEQKHAGNLTELLDARKSVLAEFYGLIGIKRLPDKKERLITEEVKNDSTLMQLNVDEMYKCRLETVESINALFGTSYTVECVADTDGDGVPQNEESEVTKGDL